MTTTLAPRTTATTAHSGTAATTATRPGTTVLTAWSCTVRLVVEDADALPAATSDLVALLDRVDRIASRFRADSALSRASDLAGRPVPVPALLVDLVGTALDAAVTTDGAVDPTLGLAMHRIGYDRDIEVIRNGVLPADAHPAVVTASAPIPPRERWRWVRLHREAGLLTVPLGCALDLGATAKAWTADHAATTLATRYRTGVLVELGGDLAVAGHRDGGWNVRVAERAGADGQLVRVDHGGLATSTTTVRTWTHRGTEVHHIVDPATGRPVDGPWRTASVWAPTAVAANAASTAAIVKGAGAVSWLTGRGLAARLVHRDGSVVTTPAWPASSVGVAARRPAAAPTQENLDTGSTR